MVTVGVVVRIVKRVWTAGAGALQNVALMRTVQVVVNVRAVNVSMILLHVLEDVMPALVVDAYTNAIRTIVRFVWTTFAKIDVHKTRLPAMNVMEWATVSQHATLTHRSAVTARVQTSVKTQSQPVIVIPAITVSTNVSDV